MRLLDFTDLGHSMNYRSSKQLGEERDLESITAHVMSSMFGSKSTIFQCSYICY